MTATPPTKTIDIFTANLRILLGEDPNVTQISREIGINRTQFNRYLSGENHPRPDVLQKICDHFNVDARVLLEPIGATAPEMRATSDTDAVVDALRFYADKQNWALDDNMACLAEDDNGDIARAALAAWESSA